MLAYNRQCLDNIALQQEVDTAFRHGYITAAEKEGVGKAYPIDCYTPNIAIRIGLFILTTIIVLFVYGLFILAIRHDFDSMGRILAFIVGIGAYAALEYVVHNKKHFQSGIDDGLLWTSTGFILAALNLDSALQWSLISCLISSFAVLRFADRGMTIIAVFSAMAALYYTFHSPFPIMIASATLYLVLQYLNWKDGLRHYADCGTVAAVAALVLVYCAGNYWVVREIGVSLMGHYLDPEQALPGGWFFWACTVVWPPVYIYFGIRRENIILIRTGVVLIAASILTYKNYYHLGPIEIELTLAGLSLIALIWWLIRYLQTPRNGFTSHSPHYLQQQIAANIESLVISESFTPPPVTPPENGFDFGGGSGGGGGAQGQW